MPNIQSGIWGADLRGRLVGRSSGNVEDCGGGFICFVYLMSTVNKLLFNCS